MLDRCNEKIRADGITNAHTVTGDITHLQLGETFDLVIAPFRVLQALATNDEVSGFFETIAMHMKPSAFGIVNVFMPKMPPEELKRKWCQPDETVCEEITLKDGSRLVHSDRRQKMDKKNLILYPDMIYRRYLNKALVEEVIHPIKMRCYYPGELTQLIKDKGFVVTACWGGYKNEPYGEGTELVVEFRK